MIIVNYKWLIYSHSESSGSEVHAIILLVLILVAVALRRLGENHLARCGMGKVYPLVMSTKFAIENHHRNSGFTH